MFSKLKAFSEDVTKSLNEVAEGYNASGHNANERRAQVLTDLKNGAKILNAETPDASELTQPEDETLSNDGTPEPEKKLIDNGRKSHDSPLNSHGDEPVNGSNTVGDESEKNGITSETNNELKSESVPISGIKKDITPIPGSQASIGNVSARVNSPKASIDLDLNSLPPVIRSKMKKFAKYEEKYPILLEAFKTEKKKGELIRAFERVLQENTPVSSISEAGTLVEYLNSLNEKKTLLNTELRKFAKESATLSSEKADLTTKLKESNDIQKASLFKIKELDEQVKSLQAESRKILEAKAIAERENQQLIAKLKAEIESKDLSLTKSEASAKHQDEKIDSLSNEIQARTEEIESLKKKIEQEPTSSAVVEDQVTGYESKIQELEQKLEDQSRLEDEKNNLTKEIDEYKDKLSIKENEINDLKAELQNKQVSTVTPENSNLHPPASQTNKNKKKKNNKKKKGGIAIPAEEEPMELVESHVEVKELKTSNQSLTEENRRLRTDLQTKTDDVENLRDSLRDLGDDLVQARDEIKDLKKASFGTSDSTANGTEEFKSLKFENDKLTKELSEKVTELEKLLESNKDLDLKANEKSKQLESLLSEHERKASDFETQVSNHMKTLDAIKISENKLRSDNDSLKEEHAKLKSELASANREIETLTKEKQGLNARINELTKFKSNDTSLKLEIASFKTSLQHKDSQIKEYKEQIQTLSKQKDELNESISKLKVNNSEFQMLQKSLLEEKSNLVTKQELAAVRTNSLTNEIAKLQSDKQAIATELEKLKSKFEILVKENSSSTNEYSIFKQQYEELSMKTKESSLKIENLEDELSESRNMLQERTRESSSIRRLLVDAEDQLKLKDTELKSELRKFAEEKIQIETSCQALIKKRQREIDELKSSSENFRIDIHELEKNIADLKEKNAELVSLNSNSSGDGQTGGGEVQQTIETLRNSLQLSTKKVRDYEHLNNVLKKLNEESNLKFERLSKNYKIITQQYRQMKSTKASPASSYDVSTDTLSSPRASTDGGSISSSDAANEEKETNTAYLKNVLLGFFEHKDQRDMLLPVIKTLFHFSSDDERKFLLALK
ncbi:hypothetical protein G9P44_003118 [Scheffersomyces stipitis]|nr:hypothetical protein G9P44_003118 [Scheffersomyces stipitis]